MSQPSQADIFAALQSQSSSSTFKPRPTTSFFSDHPDHLSSLTNPSSSEPTNKTKIYCFREGCGSLLLLPDVGEWIVAEGNVVNHLTPSCHLKNPHTHCQSGVFLLLDYPKCHPQVLIPDLS